MKGYVYFWSTKHPKYGCFSQWYQSPFTVGGITYSCTEQWMMYWKALTFGDMDTASRILKETSPKVIKGLGRAVKNYDDRVWRSVSFSIVELGNKYKFLQNPELWKILDGTGEAIICEASPVDSHWGIGMSEEDAIKAGDAWTGDNWLGWALTNVRDTIREENERAKSPEKKNA